MTEIAKGILGGSWALVSGWILPSSLGMSFFGLMVLPSLVNVPPFGGIAGASPANKAIVLLVASVILGLTLSTLATPLYRVLEGYLLWPGSWKVKRIEVHKASRQRAANEVERLRGVDGILDLQGALALERFHRYPDDVRQIAPTRLGNAIRRFEYYSYDRYQLSSQLMWNQLRGSAPESIPKAVDEARAGVDFFVCLLYVSGAVSLGALLAMLGDDAQVVTLLGCSLIGALVVLLCYPAAVKATDAWASAVRAMVDLGRVPLSKDLGLQMPSTLEEERKMWLQVGWFLGYRFHPDAAALIDPYRAIAEEESEEADK